jgi:hypothetical protein
VLTPADRLALDLRLDPDIAQLKFRALAAQETQTAALITHLGPADYTAWVSDESFVEAARRPAAGGQRRTSAAPVPGGSARPFTGHCGWATVDRRREDFTCAARDVETGHWT